MIETANNQTERALATISSAETFHYGAILQKQEKASKETGIISVALASSIAARKESTLFDTIDESAAFQAMDKKHLIDRKGKPVYLTYYQNKIIYALSLFMSQNRESEEIKTFINKLNAGESPQSRIMLPISITELTKIVEVDGKARARQKEKVIKELRTLSEVKQVQTYYRKDAAEDKVRFTASLITITEQLEDLSPDKRMNVDYVCITFGSIFFYELYTKFAVIKPSLFRIWGKTGTGTDTELFNVLLADLLAKYSNHRTAALRAVKDIKKAEYETKASYLAAKAKAQRDALTYSEYAHTLRSRVTTDYESTRKQKLDFKIHLQNAINALKKIGLITEDTKITSTDGGKRIDFVFNIDYDKNEQGESIVIAQE